MNEILHNIMAIVIIVLCVQSGIIPSDLALKLRLDLYSLMYGSEALMFFLIGVSGKIQIV